MGGHNKGTSPPVPQTRIRRGIPGAGIPWDRGGEEGEEIPGIGMGREEIPGAGYSRRGIPGAGSDPRRGIPGAEIPKEKIPREGPDEQERQRRRSQEQDPGSGIPRTGMAEEEIPGEESDERRCPERKSQVWDPRSRGVQRRNRRIGIPDLGSQDRDLRIGMAGEETPGARSRV